MNNREYERHPAASRATSQAAQAATQADCGAALLKIEGGSFRYKGGPLILDDIDIELAPGEILAVLGPNGAGKTTLLRCMMGMLRWDKGRSMLGGEDIRTMPASRLWRRMAYVPQAKSAAASYTAFQTVLLGRSSRIGVFSSPSAEDLEIAERVMTELGIRSLMDKPCHAISGGELQMVLIARAMAAEPELLVLDEPESNLDFKNQLIVLDAMSALAAKGVACIFNTHYPAHALQRADKSLLLFKGAAGEASSGAGAGPDSETTCAAGASFGAGADRGAVTALGNGAGDSGCVFGITSEVVTEENIRLAFGVEALIGEVETPRSVMKSIIPVGIARSGSAAAGAETSDRCLASTTMISDSNDAAGRINFLLSEYDHLIIGRMGLPCRSSGKYMITVMLEGPGKDIATLTHRLSLIQGISVKTTYE